MNPLPPFSPSPARPATASGLSGAATGIPRYVYNHETTFMDLHPGGGWVQFTDHTAALSRLEEKLQQLPADWSVDSSLETRFPLTAELLIDLKHQLKTADGQYDRYVSKLKERDAALSRAEARTERLRVAAELALQVLRRSLRTSSAPLPTENDLRTAFVGLHDALAECAKEAE